MQLTALTENLANVRGELKLAHEKLATIEQIKAEKAGECLGRRENILKFDVH